MYTDKKIYCSSQGNVSIDLVIFSAWNKMFYFLKILYFLHYFVVVVIIIVSWKHFAHYLQNPKACG